MDFEKKLEDLNIKIESLVNRYEVLKNENLELKRRAEEKEKEINRLIEEIEKLKHEKKEALKSIDNVINKVSLFIEGKESESLL